VGIIDAFISGMSEIARGFSGQRIVRNAMSSMLWICGLASSACFLAACALSGKDGICVFLVIVGTIPFFVACGMFIYFAIKDPDRLHSEEFRIRYHVLKLTEMKGGRIPVNPLELTDIANPFPDTKALEHKEELRKEAESEKDSGEEEHE
jgi:hypothetical protein